MSISTPQNQRVAIVTGGSGGIGRTVAERLCAEGMSVVVNYSGNAGRAQEVVERITSAGGAAAAIGGDVADEADVVALFDEAERLYGGIDVSVHAAGILSLSPLVNLDLEVFDRIIRTNLRGTFVVSQQAARRVRGGGAIINFSSSVVKRALPNYSAYSATKAAVDAITMILAKELRGSDITVNSVAPGPVATPMFLEGKDQALIDQIASSSAMGRLGQPDDIAEVVAFLAGPGRWVNGQVIYADGGLN
jgi:3-oxoacyl-[acyl-carrier protein] reductase